MWYQVRAYVVRKNEAADLFAFLHDTSFWGRWMPESGEFHDLFLGELYWSPAYQEQFAEQRGEGAWTRGNQADRLPTKVIVPTMTYGGIGTSRDCSMEESVHMLVPSPWLAEHLGLRWAGREGEFCGKDGRVITRDPSVATPGPRALLALESDVRNMLDAGGYEIIWTVLGCKGVVGEHPRIAEELQLNGAFMYRDGVMTGGVRATHHSFPGHD